jgi:C_GCAxxG_C_C family probable redox protein
MSNAETAVNLFTNYNCAQSVLSTYAGKYELDREKALQVSAGFGAGMGRLQETCGAVSGAIMVLGLDSGFKEEDRREKTNEVYAKVRDFIDDFTQANGTVICRDLLGCDLLTDEGQQYFKEQNMKAEKCAEYVRLCCELLDKFLKNG